MIPGSFLLLFAGIAPPPGYVLLGSTRFTVRTSVTPRRKAEDREVMVYQK